VIQRAEHRYGGLLLATPEWAAAVDDLSDHQAFWATVVSHLSSTPPRTVPPRPTKTAPKRTAVTDAYVNQSRWVADCPFCPSAQIVSPTDPRFFCPECYNAAVAGAYVHVVFPGDIDQIEALLDQRPDPVTRNWLPAETVTDLAAENDTIERPGPGDPVEIRGQQTPPGTAAGV
jgi:hypothetical protein